MNARVPTPATVPTVRAAPAVRPLSARERTAVARAVALISGVPS